MAALKDPEFGTITLHRSRLAQTVRLKLDARGVISISLPLRTPLFFAKQLINDSRHNLRTMLADLQAKRRSWSDGDLVGKSHTLHFEISNAYDHRIKQTQLIVSHPPDADADTLHGTIHQAVSKALRVQAKAYLPRRLQQLAQSYEFTYHKVRFNSADTRWGSCSSQGTISLNIWLMQLPFEIIDYVLIHELCHTKEMNHSPAFWQLVKQHSPDYKTHRLILQTHHPNT